ncbi:MAG: hypothetical protein ACM3ZE_18370 [Myxococcales bacterium]
MSLSLVIVIVVSVIALCVYQRNRMKQGAAQNQDNKFGAIAARLGMQVEDGEPNTNPHLLMEKVGDYKRELRASSKPYAHAGSLMGTDGVKTNDYIAIRRVVHTCGCSLQLQLQREVAPVIGVVHGPLALIR